MTDARRPAINRLVLWNIDLTLVDVVRVSREAYADAFRRVTGRPLVALPLLAGQTDSEIFFEALALNEAGHGLDGSAEQDEELLARYVRELAAAFRARRDQLVSLGRSLPGATAALAAVGELPGVVQSVLTGTIQENAIEKLRAFGLDRYLDTEIGGYGSQPYPKGAGVLMSRTRAAEKYDGEFGPESAVYIGDSVRDIEAAAIGGARSMGVASGRSTASDLAEAGADLVLPDLADTAAVVGAIATLTTAVAAG